MPNMKGFVRGMLPVAAALIKAQQQRKMQEEEQRRYEEQQKYKMMQEQRMQDALDFQKQDATNSREAQLRLEMARRGITQPMEQQLEKFLPAAARIGAAFSGGGIPKDAKVDPNLLQQKIGQNSYVAIGRDEQGRQQAAQVDAGREQYEAQTEEWRKRFKAGDPKFIEENSAHVLRSTNMTRSERDLYLRQAKERQEKLNKSEEVKITNQTPAAFLKDKTDTAIKIATARKNAGNMDIMNPLQLDDSEMRIARVEGYKDAYRTADTDVQKRHVVNKYMQEFGSPDMTYEEAERILSVRTPLAPNSPLMPSGFRMPLNIKKQSTPELSEIIR